ncbi:hypothetical protein ACHQM5_017214 [Ranunculus cassubicifolius]
MSMLLEVAFTVIQDQGDEDTTTTLSTVSRFGYPQRWHAQVGCNKFPRTWRSWQRRGPGHDCYRKKWDNNSLMDQFNCGKRGHMCGYGQICCGGKCVNPFFDKANCGGCNSGCNKGEFCAFGMCNYAT